MENCAALPNKTLDDAYKYMIALCAEGTLKLLADCGLMYSGIKFFWRLMTYKSKKLSKKKKQIANQENMA